VAQRQSRTATAEKALDIAEALVQVNGYNGFSYADVAAQLSVTNAALHYHFRGKAELGEALIARYSERFLDALQAIDGEGLAPSEKLRRYAGLYSAVLRQRRMCLCGMLAAEFHTLPEPMRTSVVAFFDANEAWLAAVLRAGALDGSLSFTGTPETAAGMVVATLEGAMLIARSSPDAGRFEAAAEQLLIGLLASRG
jgi:TetR/AcrR family transcriptional repressor of nem operon